MIVSGGQLVDLSLPMCNRPGRRNPTISYVSHAEAARQRGEALGFDPADLATPGIHFASEYVRASVHGSGTHVDAPWHYGPVSAGVKARSIDELPLDWFYGPGVVLDFSTKPEGSIIEPSDIEHALKGHQLLAGDIVLMRTCVPDDPWDLDRMRELSRPAAEYLLDRGVRTIGVDAASPERSHVEDLKAHKPENYFPVHSLGRTRELCLVELLANLHALPHDGFHVVLFPVKIAGGSGGWCRAVAFVPALGACQS